MTRTAEALVKPELLAWARRSIRMDVEEAAHKIGVKPETLAKWEAGEQRPTVRQLRDAAAVYKRPLAVFYLPEPPKEFDAMHDFRLLHGAEEAERSPALALEIRRAIYRREIAISLSQEIGEEIPEFAGQGTLNEDPDEFAKKVRGSLGLNQYDQPTFRNEYHAFNFWSEAIQERGVLVFQTSHVELVEMRGLSISERLMPVIVVNAKDTPRGRIFTLMHEYVHLFLHKGGLCDLEEGDAHSAEDEATEILCNRVAGAVLVPGPMLQEDDLVKNKRRTGEWDDKELGALSAKYQVSREVILRRLVIVGKATQDFYRQKRQQWLRQYAQMKRGKGFISPTQESVRNNGPRFVKLVLRAYNEEAITASDVSEFLGIRLKHLDALVHTGREMFFLSTEC